MKVPAQDDDRLSEFPTENTAEPSTSIFDFVSAAATVEIPQVSAPVERTPALSRRPYHWGSSGAVRAGAAIATRLRSIARKGHRVRSRIRTRASVLSQVIAGIALSLWRRRDTLRRLAAWLIAVVPRAARTIGTSRMYPPAFSKPLGLFVSGLSVGALVMWIVSVPFAGGAALSRSVEVAANARDEGPSPVGVSGVSADAPSPGITGITGSRARQEAVGLTMQAGTTNPRPELRRAVAKPLPVQRPAAARRAAAVPLPRFRGSLVVRSSPSGASVFVNGRLVGTTPLTLNNQAVGSRAVRVTKDGYQAWTAATRVVVNQQSLVAADLRPVAQPANQASDTRPSTY